MQAQQHVQIVQQKLESSYAINSYIYYAIILLSREWGVFPKHFYDVIKEPILYTLNKHIDDEGVQHMGKVLKNIAELIKKDELKQVGVYILKNPEEQIDQALCYYQVNVSYKENVVMVVDNRKNIVKDFNEGLSSLLFQVHAKKGHMQINPKQPFYISIDIIQEDQIEENQGLSTLASRFSRRKRTGMMKSQLAFSENTPTKEELKLYHSKMGSMLSSQDDSIASRYTQQHTIDSPQEEEDEDLMKDDVFIENPNFKHVQTVDDLIKLNQRRSERRSKEQTKPQFKLNATYHALQSELDMLLSSETKL
mmetsp:Transcript_13766/g.20864  ORF Transcript_13766/g.20864 Transcript_13766/m.20864 type:complete len:308 (-) Transcript_13766:27-950(-)